MRRYEKDSLGSRTGKVRVKTETRGPGRRIPAASNRVTNRYEASQKSFRKAREKKKEF